MSVNYYARVVFGYPIEGSARTIRKPNPLFGLAKFDPNTGNRVEQYITKQIDLEELIDELRVDGLDVFYTTYREGDEDAIVGIPLTKSIEIGGNDLHRVKDAASADSAVLSAALKELCCKLNIGFDPSLLATYLVGRCSY